MQGFDAEFRDLDHYIRVITDRIWEGRRLDDIHRYYGADCAVETPSSVTVGTGPVIDGTRATLTAFPDRRLLAEDVIVSGDPVQGYLSSHRIFSPMTHAGPGAFGPPTGRPVHVRTIADCVCVGHRIVHEWLVRDQAAIARQTGRHERDVAQDWLDRAGGWHKPAMPPPPGDYRSAVSDDARAQAWAHALQRAWAGDGRALQATHHAGVIAALPGGEAAVGREALLRFWGSLGVALQDARWSIEHLALVDRPGRATALALRWRVWARHTGAGRYGPPTGRAVELLGISHAEWGLPDAWAASADGGASARVLREWHLIDDVATWMQLLQPASARAAVGG
jgi:predicted ester cyclase